MTPQPAAPRPACPECGSADAVRRLTDPFTAASHRCGACRRSFTHGRVA